MNLLKLNNLESCKIMNFVLHNFRGNCIILSCFGRKFEIVYKIMNLVKTISEATE